MKINSQKGYIVPLIIAIVAVAALGSAYVYWHSHQSQQLVGNDRDAHGCIGSAGYSWSEAEQKCVRPWEENASSTSNDTNASNSTQNGQTSTPVITSILPSSVTVGNTITVQGTNLRGFEGDENVWIQNVSTGQKGIIKGDPSSTDNMITFTLADKYCTADVSYSGAPCPSYLSITPGNYVIYANPWGTESNNVNVKIISGPSITIISPKGGEIWKAGTDQTVTVQINPDPRNSNSHVDLILTDSTGDVNNGYSLGGGVTNNTAGTYSYPVKLPDNFIGQDKIYAILFYSPPAPQDCPKGYTGCANAPEEEATTFSSLFTLN